MNQTIMNQTIMNYLQISNLIDNSNKLNEYEIYVMETIQKRFDLLQKDELELDELDFLKKISIYTEIYLLLGKYDVNSNYKFHQLTSIMRKNSINMINCLNNLLKIESFIKKDRFMLEKLLEILKLFNES